MAQTLKFGNKVWAAKEDSVLAYNDINNNYKPLPFDFSRASIGTRVNKDGLIETMGQDIARIDYTDSADGVLLLEPSSTNLVTYSELFNTYLSVRVDATITDNYGISPDGSLNSSRIQFVDETSYCYAAISVSTSHTSSCYVKGVKGETVKFGIGSTVATGQSFLLNGNWQRIEYTLSTANQIFFSTYGGVTARDFEVFGLQLEALSYATSYIPTSGSTVTRAAETCNNSGNSEVFNDSEGVLFADIAALATAPTRVITLGDGTSSNRIQFFYNSSNVLNGNVIAGGSGQVTGFSYDGNSNLFNKCAVKYKVNDFAFWVNGFEVATDTSGATPIGLNELNFDNGTGTSDFYGKTKELGYYNTALTDAELETLTSYRNWVSMVNELNLNIIYNG